MSDFQQVIAVKALPEWLKALVVEPAAWTRLEPQSVTGDPTPGLEARVHDPLWLLARQWQFGEFRGEDAGTPLGVEVQTVSQPVTAWQPGDPSRNADARALPANEPIDPSIEREPPAPTVPGLRQRAEAGSLLVTTLAEAGFEARAALLAACPLALPSEPQLPRLFQTLALASPDAEAAATSLESAGAAGPAWLAGASADALTAAQEWLGWYRRSVSPLAADAPESWIPERLEYRFSVRTGSGESQRVFRAPLHDGGAIDWYSFDHDAQRQLAVPNEEPAGAQNTRRRTMMASPLRYAGMPSDRLWQFEDGAV